MNKMATVADKRALEAEMPLSDRWAAKTVYQYLQRTAERFPNRPAISYQIRSGPKDKAETLVWRDLLEQVTRAANLFRRLATRPGAKVAYILPNANETVITLLGGMTSGGVCPVNPLLEPDQIGAILSELDVEIVVTLAPFPKSDVAEKAAEAVAHAPCVKAVLEVDLKHYLSPPTSWIVPLIRPKHTITHKAQVLDFHQEISKERGDTLDFSEPDDDAVCAYFHTGGTTGLPKIAQHRHSGIIYNGWCAERLLFTEEDVLICPLPLFHVMAAYPILMACVSSGAHMVLPTPAGYRGDGVLDNFWKLIERWKVTFMVTVPTAAAALMQRPVDADVSTLKFALCGSAPLPVELFRKFEAACSVKILEGYGMTEATCLVSCNPVDGERKIGSVGLPMPYTEVKILNCAPDGTIIHACGTDEIGEICIESVGVFPGYVDTSRNTGVFTQDGLLRTGDLGRRDADGFLWITGRAKDLIIRGGHNIDPAVIEEALAAHPEVAFVGAIGQPDAYSGELPSAYVELVAESRVTVQELMAHAEAHVSEDAARPKYVEILEELPKTAVGKVFKPALRKSAIRRVFDDALSAEGIEARVEDVTEHKLHGLVAKVTLGSGTDEAKVKTLLGRFPTKFELSQ